ncbi:diacylglycerol/lipid kinase family protein [Halpernia sp.]|uniref:diacylglycerol/lipid kinase family protein n=1 Tax=Halpernia sp. TaxID=2782209 RepID=UPI003A93C165
MPNTKITFIIHAKLRGISSLKSEIEATFSNGYEIKFKSTNKTFGAKDSAIEAIEENAEIIVICGGDGSINETVNGFLETENSHAINFGVLPLGTGNDFSRSLSVKNNLQELKSLIEQRKTIDVSVFKMNFIDKKQNENSRYFVNISDIGLGGFVVKKVSHSSKILGGNITYFLAIIFSFLQYKKQAVQLKSDTFNWEGNMMSLCMANGKYFGSGMCIAPDANICDDRLQLTILGNVSLWDYIKNLNKIRKGQKIKHKEIFYTSVNNCKITSKENPCPIDMDGEFIGFTPLEVNLAERKISFYGIGK